KLGHAPGCLLVQARVLDRPSHERRARDEELHLLICELARRLRVKRDDTNHLIVPPNYRNRDQRLEPLLLELRHILHTRISESVVTNKRSTAMLNHPPRQS